MNENELSRKGSGIMAPPDSVPRIQENDVLVAEADRVGRANGRPVLLQLGSEKCLQCPAFTEAVAALAEEYSFEWRYCDAHEDNDILETYGITQLPAVVYMFQDETKGLDEVLQRADGAQLRAMVDEQCARKPTPVPTDVDLFNEDF